MQRAMEVMTDPEEFYDYSLYRQSAMVLKRWLDVLSVRGFPRQFEEFTLRHRHVGSLASISDLTAPEFVDRPGCNAHGASDLHFQPMEGHLEISATHHQFGHFVSSRPVDSGSSNP